VGVDEAFGGLVVAAQTVFSDVYHGVGKRSAVGAQRFGVVAVADVEFGLDLAEVERLDIVVRIDQGEDVLRGEPIELRLALEHTVVDERVDLRDHVVGIYGGIFLPYRHTVRR